MMEVANKIVIITGSAQGLGRMFAKVLLREGARVCISDINEEAGVQTAGELQKEFGKENVTFIRCDVTQEDQLVNLYDGAEKYFTGSVDIFCNNAGIGQSKGWRLCMEIDIMAVMAGTRLAMDRMDVSKGGKGGIVVNTASVAGLVPAVTEDLTPYFVAKTAVVALTRSLGQDAVLQRSGVRVQAICPNFADTKILDELIPGGKQRIGQVFGRVMTAEYVADGFLKTIKHGENGAVVIIHADAPPFQVGGVPELFYHVVGHVSKAMNLLTGMPLLTIQTQIRLFISFIFILGILFFRLL